MAGQTRTTARTEYAGTVRSWRTIVVIWIILAVGTTASFVGISQNSFIDLDDGPMIVENSHINQGLTLDGLRFALTQPHLGNWQPLTALSHMLDCHLFGVNRPGLHHLAGLAMHVASALLLFEAFRRMTGDVWPSALVAALFAVHPLRVESVAWASERKDVLSALFMMLVLLAYVGYARRPGSVRYLMVLLTFGLGLMSKPMLVTLPCVLLLLDWWPLRRWRPEFLKVERGVADEGPFPRQATSRLLLEKVPLLAAAAVAGWIAVRMQNQSNASTSLEALSLPWRLANAAVSYVVYLRQSIWPTNLAVLYPHPGMAPSAELGRWIYPAAGAGLLLLLTTAAVLLSARRRPYLLVGWLWYLGMLVPVIGLFQIGLQAHADRYTYLPMIGISVAVAWGLQDLTRRWTEAKPAVVVGCCAWLAVLMVLTWVQVGYWRDSNTLFSHTLSVTSNNFLVHNNLGNVLGRSGQDEQAIQHFEAALKIKPDYAEAHNNLGNILDKLGRPQDAVTHYLEAVRLEPNHAQMRSNLAVTLEALGHREEAVPHYQEALRLDPNAAEFHFNWGGALYGMQRFEEAAAEFREALRLKPDYAQAHNNLGTILAQRGEYNEAIEHFQEAVRLKPDYTAALDNLRISQQNKALRGGKGVIKKKEPAANETMSP